jgi:hypothetical protein
MNMNNIPQTPYLAVIGDVGPNWIGWVVDLGTSVVVTGQTADEVTQALAEALTELSLYGDKPLPPAMAKEVPTDAAALTADLTKPETRWVVPAPANPLSVSLHHAVIASGLTMTELAKLCGTSRSALNRLTDPFYWAHNMIGVYTLCKVLGVKVIITLVPNATAEAAD